MGAGTFRFGEFELDGVRQQLVRDGEVVEIHARPLRLLLYLIEHHDRVVPKQELFDLLWPGIAVSDSSLSTAVYEARQALGDDHSGQRWIRTAKGRGFQFVGEVQPDPATPGAVAPPGEVEREQHQWVRVAPAAAVLLVAAAVGAWALWPRVPPVPPPPATSLLVLPFVDLSPAGDHAWLASGMAEELIETLAQVPQLEVKARTSGEVAQRMGWDIPEIGRRVGVRHVIEGSVRREDGRLRVTVQLIDAASGFHLWARAYDLAAADILDLQTDIATAVAAALDGPLGIRRRGTDSVEAWEEYLLAQAHRHGGNAQRAIQHLERAVELDPAFASAHVAMAESRGRLCRHGRRADCDPVLQPRAWESIESALALDPHDAGAHHVRAALLADRRDWAGAETAVRHALELGPPGASSLLLGTLLLARGEIEDGLDMLERVATADPVSPETCFFGAFARIVVGIDLERALELLERAHELSPEMWHAGFQRVTANHLLGRDARALEALLEAPIVPAEAKPAMREAFARGGWAEMSEVFTGRFYSAAPEIGEADPCRRSPGSGYTAAARVRAGDLDGALSCLEEAARSGGLGLGMQLGVSWFWDPLRDDPRFEAILEGMDLAEVSAQALPRVRAYRDCTRPLPSIVRCTERQQHAAAR